MSEKFEEMSRDDQLYYLIEHLRDLPEELVDPGIDILLSRGETEYAIALANESGRTSQAIDISVENGDYLWAAMIAKKAGDEETSQRLYQEGLEYYINMEMYGRAVSAAKALNFPQHEIDSLFLAGIRSESKRMDMSRAQMALESVALSLEGVLIDRDDEMAKELRSAMKEELERYKGRNFEND